MWEHGGGSESVQQDALTQCGLLECYDTGTHDVVKGRRHWNYFGKWNRKVDSQITFVAVLNACASIVAIEEGRHAHE
jgi:hypothetical protein